MKQERVLAITEGGIYTSGGFRRVIGSVIYKTGDLVWVDNGCVFGHEPTRSYLAPLVLSEESLAGFIAADITGGYFHLYGLAAEFPVLLKKPISSSFAGAYLVYNQHKIAFIWFETGQIRVKVLGESEYIVALSDNVPIYAKDAYFDENNDLMIAVFLYTQEPLLCKMGHYKNQEIIGEKDFFADIKQAMSDYAEFIKTDVSQALMRYQQIPAENSLIFNEPVNYVINGAVAQEGEDDILYDLYFTLTVGLFKANIEPVIALELVSYSLWATEIILNLTASSYKSHLQNIVFGEVFTTTQAYLVVEAAATWAGTWNKFKYSLLVAGDPNSGRGYVPVGSGPFSSVASIYVNMQAAYQRAVTINTNGAIFKEIASGIEGKYRNDKWRASGYDGNDEPWYGPINFNLPAYVVLSIDIQTYEMYNETYIFNASWNTVQNFNYQHQQTVLLAHNNKISIADNTTILSVNGSEYDVSAISHIFDYMRLPLVCVKGDTILYYKADTLWSINKTQIKQVLTANLQNLQMPVIKITKTNFNKQFT